MSTATRQDKPRTLADMPVFDPHLRSPKTETASLAHLQEGF
jgi:hypothetical protein